MAQIYIFGLHFGVSNCVGVRSGLRGSFWRVGVSPCFLKSEIPMRKNVGKSNVFTFTFLCLRFYVVRFLQLRSGPKIFEKISRPQNFRSEIAWDCAEIRAARRCPALPRVKHVPKDIAKRRHAAVCGIACEIRERAPFAVCSLLVVDLCCMVLHSCTVG